jgi:endonuclease IV
MKIGVKIFPEDFEYAKKVAKYCDFFELMAIPGSDFKKIKELDKPFTIHCIHSRWGFNPADPAKKEINAKGAKAASEAADILGADVIVIHPGYLETGDCSIDNAVSFLSALDSRFIIENMPEKEESHPHLGNSFDAISSMLKKTNKGICLDFAHAAAYAKFHGIDHINFIKKLTRFKPKYFHISDTRIETGEDLHLHLKEGDLKLLAIAKLIPKDSRILIETNQELKKQHQDILLLRELC